MEGGTLINQDFRWLKEVKELQRKKIPLFCFGTGVAQEDFWRQRHDEYWKNYISEWVKILSSFLFFGVRGPISKKILLDNGLKNVVVVGDTALSLAPNTFKRKKYNKVIGINFGVAKGNPMWGGHPDKFLRQMTLLIKYLLLQNYKIILLPVWNDDLPSNKKVQKYKMIYQHGNYHCLKTILFYLFLYKIKYLEIPQDIQKENCQMM